MFVRSQPCEYNENAHKGRTITLCKRTVENFVRIVRTVFEKIRENRENDCFMAIFGLRLAMFLTSSYTFLMPLRTQGPLWV